MSTSKYFIPGASMTNKPYKIGGYLNDSCVCYYNNIVKKGIYSNIYPNISNRQRVANIISRRLGNRVIFGNIPYGGNNNLNYLGRKEGQLGGGGRPIRNQF